MLNKLMIECTRPIVIIIAIVPLIIYATCEYIATEELNQTEYAFDFILNCD